MTPTRTLVAHCRMRSQGQVVRVLERMRHLGFIKNLLAEHDDGLHRHNRRAATHGLQPVQGGKLFARIPGHNQGKDIGLTGYEPERLVAYPRREELFQELTRTLEMLRAEHPDEPLVHIPVNQLRGAIHDYLRCREHESRRGKFKRVSACRSIRWTALPKVEIDGLQVHVDGGLLGKLRARLERSLEAGEEVDQVKLVRRQLAEHRVGPSRFELHVTVSVRPAKPKYVRPRAMTAEEREQRKVKQREARTQAQRLAREHKEREARVQAEHEATTRGRICGVDIGGRHTAVDDTNRQLTPKRRDRHLRRAQSRAISRKRKGSRGWKRACARKRKNDARVSRRNREQRMKHAAVTVREHDVIVTDEGKLQARTARGGRAKARMNRSQLEAGGGEYRAMLEYQAGKRGKLAVRMHPGWTTRQCIHCTARDTKANSTVVRCRTCGETTPRDAAGGVNLALKWIAKVESNHNTGLSRSGAPGGHPCPRSRSWTARPRSLLRRGSSVERLRTVHDILVHRAMGSWGANPPRRDRNSDHVRKDKNGDHFDQS